jgi:YD repeat-containing protein
VTVGAKAVAYALDEEGKTEWMTDDQGKKTTFEYDALGRVRKKTYEDPSGGGKDMVEVTERDPSSGEVVRTESGTKKTTITRDAMGRPTSVVSDDGTVDLEFTGTDGAGRLASMTDHRTGLTETYEYADADGRLTKVTRTGTGVSTTKTLTFGTNNGGTGEKIGKRRRAEECRRRRR